MSENEDNTDTSTVSNIVVCVRVRPVEKDVDKSIVRVVYPNVIVLNPIQGVLDTRKNYQMNKIKKSEYRYAFDHVFDDMASQQQVYENTCKHLIKILLDGYNASVFAYGATGSGKTHTMLGNKQSGRGIMYLMLCDIFKAFERESAKGREFKMDVSYVEVYNENIRDLLYPTNNLNGLTTLTRSKPKFLELWEDPKLGVIIQDVSIHHPKNAEDVLNLLGLENIYYYIILLFSISRAW
jgi:kinesin family protein 18/19